ncbi:MAG: histidine kinase dimerization/phospho-acceptor domain-containing protein [Ferruginibacter sp.]
MENNSKIVSAGLICLLHEMNNPLTSIKLCLELLQTASEETRGQYYAIINKSAEQLQHAVHELSDTFLKDGFYVDFHSEEGITMKIAPDAVV